MRRHTLRRSIRRAGYAVALVETIAILGMWALVAALVLVKLAGVWFGK
jgi:hypothetical protein